MKFARRDYNRRIVDMDEQIPEEEPCFLIRGQDQLAPAILMEYARAAQAEGRPPEEIASVQQHAERMRDWQRDVRSKRATIPRHELEVDYLKIGIFKDGPPAASD